MKGLLRKDLYLMIKYCRLFFILIIVFSFAGAWYSGNLFVGLLAGMLGGLVVSLLHGLLSITLVQNQSVSGLAINMLMLGVTSFLFKLMSDGQGYQQIDLSQYCNSRII